MSLADSIANARKSVVRVEASTGQGSGVVVKPGVVLTNEHVVRNESVVTVFDDADENVAGRVFWRDKDQDLAGISVSAAQWPPIGLADLSHVREGDEVIAVGHPLGLGFTVTKGIVSAKSRQYAGQIYLQTDAAINPGNSGGPLLDTKGRLVAINTFLLRGGNALNFAIPVDRAFAAISLAMQDLSHASAVISCHACTSSVSIDQRYCPVCGVTMRTANLPTAVTPPAHEKMAASQLIVVSCPACGSRTEGAFAYCQVCGKRLRN